jgi:hypothetical protein
VVQQRAAVSGRAHAVGLQEMAALEGLGRAHIHDQRARVAGAGGVEPKDGVGVGRRRLHLCTDQ